MSDAYRSNHGNTEGHSKGATLGHQRERLDQALVPFEADPGRLNAVLGQRLDDLLARYREEPPGAVQT